MTVRPPARPPADEQLTESERIMLARLVEPDGADGLMIPQLRYSLPRELRYTYKVIGMTLTGLVDRGLLRQYRTRVPGGKHGPRRFRLTEHGLAVIALHERAGSE